MLWTSENWLYVEAAQRFITKWWSSNHWLIYIQNFDFQNKGVLYPILNMFMWFFVLLVYIISYVLEFYRKISDFLTFLFLCTIINFWRCVFVLILSFDLSRRWDSWWVSVKLILYIMCKICCFLTIFSESQVRLQLCFELVGVRVYIVIVMTMTRLWLFPCRWWDDYIIWCDFENRILLIISCMIIGFFL